MIYISAILDYYYALEDKWFDFLDWLSDRGLPVYKVIDPIEKAGIPSLPVFAAIGLIAVFVVATSLMAAGGPAAPATIAFTLQVADQNAIAVDGALVSISQDGAQLAGGPTDSSGLFNAEIPAGTYDLKISAANCDTKEEALQVSDDMDRTVALTLNCAGTQAGLISLCFSPKGIGTVNALVYKVVGQEARYKDKISDCGVDGCELMVRSGFKYKFESRGYISDVFYSADSLRQAAEAAECLPLVEKADETPLEMGSVTVTVKQTDGTLVPGLLVKLVNPVDDAAAVEDGIGHTGYSGPSLGRVSFDLRVGTSFRVLIPAGENSIYYRGNETYNVTDEPLEIDVILNVSARTSFITQEKVAGVTKPLAGTEVALFDSLDAFIGSGLTNPPDAEFAIGLNKDEAYRATFFKEGYRYSEMDVTGGSDNVVMLEKIAAEEVGGIDVYVMFKDSQIPVQGATLTLVSKNNSKRTGYGMPQTNEDGFASYDWVLPGEYCIIVSRGEGEPTRCDDNPVTVIANDRVEKTIELAPNSFKLRVDVLMQSGEKVWKANVALVDKFSDASIASGQTLRDGHVTFDVPESTTVQARVDYKDANATYKQVSETLFMDKNRALTIILVPVDNKVRFIGIEHDTSDSGSSGSDLFINWGNNWQDFNFNTGQGQQQGQGQQAGEQQGGQGQGQGQGQAGGQNGGDSEGSTEEGGASGLAVGSLFLAAGSDAPVMAAGKVYKAKFTLGLKNPIAGSRELWESVVYDALDQLKVSGEYPLEFFAIPTFEGASVSEGLPSNAETFTLSGNYENADSVVQISLPIRVKQVFNGTLDHSIKYKAQWNKEDLVIKDPKTDWYTTPEFKIQGGQCKRYGDLGVCKYILGISQIVPSAYTGQLNAFMTIGLEITNEGSADFGGSAKLTDELSVINFQQATTVTKVGTDGKESSLVKNRDFTVAPQEVAVNANEYTSLAHGEKLVILASAQAVSPVKRTSIKASAADADVGTYAFRINGIIDAMVNVDPESLYDLTPSLKFNVTERVAVADGIVPGKMLDITTGKIVSSGKGRGISCDIPDILNDLRTAGGTGHVTRDSSGTFTLLLDNKCRLLTNDLSFVITGDFFRDINEAKTVKPCIETATMPRMDVTATLRCPIKLTFSKEAASTSFEEGADDCSLGRQANLNVKVAEGCPTLDITTLPAIDKVKTRNLQITPATQPQCSVSGDNRCKTGGDNDRLVWFNFTKALDPGTYKDVTLRVPFNATPTANSKILSSYEMKLPFRVSTKECIAALPEELPALEVMPQTDCKLMLKYGSGEGYDDYDCSDGEATLNVNVKDECIAGAVSYGKPTVKVVDEAGNKCPAKINEPGDKFCSTTVKDDRTITFKYTSTALLSQANPIKNFIMNITVSTKAPDTTKELTLPVKVELKQCLLIRPKTSLDSLVIRPNNGCKINLKFGTGSSDYTDADCDNGDAELNVVLNSKDCPLLKETDISLDPTVTVYDADGNECGPSQSCTAQVTGNAIKVDYTTSTKPKDPRFTVKAKIKTANPAASYDLELPLLIGTKASLSRPPFSRISLQKYGQAYDCTLRWCTPEQLLKYAGDASTGYTTTKTPSSNVLMADVNMNYDNGMTLEIMKQLYPSSSSLVLGYPDVDSAKAAANIPQPGSGQNLIIFNTNKPPKFGENKVTITKGYLDSEKLYPYAFVSFDYVTPAPSSEVAYAMTTIKGVQLFMPASNLNLGKDYIETNFTNDASDLVNGKNLIVNVGGMLSAMWGLTDAHMKSGKHVIVTEVCAPPGTSTMTGKVVAPDNSVINVEDAFIRDKNLDYWVPNWEWKDATHTTLLCPGPDKVKGNERLRYECPKGSEYSLDEVELQGGYSWQTETGAGTSQACRSLSERTGGDTTIPAIYRDSTTNEVHFVADSVDKLFDLVKAFREAVVDGKTTLEVRNMATKGGYLTPVSEQLYRVYMVTGGGDSEANAMKTLSDDSDLRTALKDAIAAYSKIDDKSKISLTALTEDDIADENDLYGPRVVIALCDKIDNCLKTEADGTTENYYASDIIDEFKAEFGGYANIPGGIYFVRQRDYSGYQGTVDVHYVFTPTLDIAKALLKGMAGSAGQSVIDGIPVLKTGPQADPQKYAAMVVTTPIPADSLYVSLKATTDDFNWVLQVHKTDGKCRIGTVSGGLTVYDSSGKNLRMMYPGTTYFVAAKKGSPPTIYVKPLDAETKDDSLPLCPLYGTVFSDNFDDNNIGDWTVTTTGNGKISPSSNAKVSGSYSLYLNSKKSDKAYAAAPSFRLDYTKDYDVSFNFRRDANDQGTEVFKNRHIYIDQVSEPYLSCWGSLNNQLTGASFLHNMELKKFYSITLKVRPSEKKYDVSVDGSNVATCDFMEDSSVSTFRVGDTSDNSKPPIMGAYGEAYWDDIKIGGYWTQ